MRPPRTRSSSARIKEWTGPLRLNETALIQADIDVVWANLADPACWPLWHQKILAVERHGHHPLMLGETFPATFQLKRRTLPSQIEVRQCEPPHLLVLRQSYEHGRRFRYADVAFVLDLDEGGVRLTQSVDLKGTGTPWLLRLLVWWIHHYGRPTSISPVEQLKRVIETQNAQHPNFVGQIFPRESHEGLK